MRKDWVFTPADWNAKDWREAFWNILRAGRTGVAAGDGATGDRYPDGTRASLLPKPLARGAEAHRTQDSRNV